MGIKSHFHFNGFALETEAWRNSEMTHSYAQFIWGGGGVGKTKCNNEQCESGKLS